VWTVRPAAAALVGNSPFYPPSVPLLSPPTAEGAK
jgi:hypothetical protein